MLRPTILIAFLYCVTGCKNPTPIEIATEKLPVVNSQLFPVKSALAGTWHYSFPFYSSTLVLDTSGTFSFCETGCTGSSYSRGVWTNNANEVILKSLEDYKNACTFSLDSVPIFFNYTRYLYKYGVLTEF